jgi:putative nucleotidyltransferase with HDIG domain
MPRKIAAYIAFIVVAAIIAAGCVASLPGITDGSAVRAALCFAGIGLVAQIMAFRLPSSAAGSIAFVPYLAAALVAPSLVTVTIVTGCVALAEIQRRAALSKALFNIAQHCVAISSAILVYRSLGGQAFRDGYEVPLVAFACLTTVFLFANYFAVSGVIAISQGRPLLAVWRSNTVRTLAYDVIALPVVYCFIQVYLKLGIPGLILLAVLVLGARQLYTANLELERANQDLLQVMVAAIELRDPYTSGHSQRVARYSKVIARAIGLAPKEVERVGVAALLHDVGKIDQRFAEILQKPGRLTEEERLVIEEHPVRSAELVAMVSGLQDLVTPVRHHHERWDGGGYPDGLAGEQIPLISRIIVFADTIDAMTSDRPYRPALGPADVRRELVKHRAKQFDPYICDRLLASDQYESLFANGPTRDEPLLVPSAQEVPAAAVETHVTEPVIAA